MTALKPQYHPFLFVFMALSALAELGLTVFLIYAGNADGTWPRPRYHSLLIFFSFNSVWTIIFSMAYTMWIIDGAVHLLASVASSVIWLLVTTALWGVASGMMYVTRIGGNCPRSHPISRCRQSLTVEALGWGEFGLCILALITTCVWVRGTKRSYRSSYYA